MDSLNMSSVVQRLGPLSSSITFLQLYRLLSITRRILPEISNLTQVSTEKVERLELPVHITRFLVDATGIPTASIKHCWEAFREVIASCDEELYAICEDDVFRLHGTPYQIGAAQIRPPMDSCPRAGCNSRSLGEPRRVEGRHFTLRSGVMPIWSLSLYCRKCMTRYYHNYQVQRAAHERAQRVYYGGIPDILHVHETAFVAVGLCELIETEMAFAHTSAETLARVYNTALAAPASTIPSASRLKDSLDAEIVLDSFFLHALLRDHDTQSSILHVPHSGPQSHRFDTALRERNYRIVGTGQEMWAHACNLCMKIYTGDDDKQYRMTAGVTDGVTVGHPCCSVLNCTVELKDRLNRFCSEHTALNKQCAIKECTRTTTVGFQTCDEPTHRQTELQRRDTGTGMSLLRERIRRAGTRPTDDVGGSPEEVLDTQRSEGTKVHSGPKGNFGRSWTHNEQLFVRCCGIIISRATFYGSEGISGVVMFLKATFPSKYPGSMPSYIFFDTNCRVVQHLRNIGDHYFDRVGMPVDVFHAKTKHKETDVFCQTYCNPAHFQELMDGQNRWVFNSSAAEQANVWFGKYHTLVREMSVPRYNFYLDEMIAIHNRFTASNLYRRGHKPHFVPEEVLVEE